MNVKRALPMFLLAVLARAPCELRASVPAMLRNGFGFWVALAAGCALTIVLYGLMVWAGPRFGLRM
jgi:hypothetical protein